MQIMLKNLYHEIVYTCVCVCVCVFEREREREGVYKTKRKVKVPQLCLTLCDPMDYTVHGILQARILKWVAIPFSRRSSQPRDRTQVS